MPSTPTPRRRPGGRPWRPRRGWWAAEPEREVPPEELFERLKPFKDRVVDDIGGDQK
jgi:hypothetical protein